MKPCTFQRTTVLSAPIERIFAFHADPRNVGRISPAWQQVEIVRAVPATEPGQEFEIVVRLFLLPGLRWRGVWRVVERPFRLVDEALSAGPFALWRHEHNFRAIDAERTEMTDRVTYLFTGGWLSGLFSHTLGRWQMRLMFADRHARTRRWALAQAADA